MQDVCFLGADDLRVGVENLLQERGPRARMPAKKSQRARRSEFGIQFAPTLEDVGGNGLLRFANAFLNTLKDRRGSCCCTTATSR